MPFACLTSCAGFRDAAATSGLSLLLLLLLRLRVPLLRLWRRLSLLQLLLRMS